MQLLGGPKDGLEIDFDGDIFYVEMPVIPPSPYHAGQFVPDHVTVHRAVYFRGKRYYRFMGYE